MKREEKDYYAVVKRWFKKKYDYSEAKEKHRIAKSPLLSADVFAWKNDITYACEVKPYPLPIGASGYGAIGQALMLKQHAKIVYVACVASERKELVSGPVIYWKNVMQRSSTRSLLKALHIHFPDNPVFSDYHKVAKQIFSKYFLSTGIGFLIVHEIDSLEDIENSYCVKEVVKPKD